MSASRARPVSPVRIGQGIDAHRLEAGRPLVLGGVSIPADVGLAGHSDGDVLLHALARALLGALGAGDLGELFPSLDPSLRGVASSRLVEQVMERVRGAGHAVAQADATVVAERPRLAAHRAAMAHRVAELLEAAPGAVSVQITSTDGLGAIGRGEGIAALAVVLLVPIAEAR